MARRRGADPIWLSPGGPLVFPDPRLSDAEGLVAVGGDLSPERLLLAYGAGIFPWYEEGVPPLWWSPDPRAILGASDLHVAKRLQRTLRAGGFTLTWNRCFDEVVARCAKDRAEGTWIIPEIAAAYGDMHARGHAHSLEVWTLGELAGGLYGVQLGGLFAAESMFHRVRDASKIARVSAVRSLFRSGIEVFDVQFSTPHLATMGARTVSRDHYVSEVARVRDLRVDLTKLEPSWRE